MSYLVQNGRVRERVHFVGMSGYSGKRSGKRASRALGGGIFGALGAVGGETVSFEEGVIMCSAALGRLAVLGRALEQTATNSTQAGIGTEVFQFAAGGAARGLQRAIENRDVGKLRSLQDQIKNITSVAADELRDSIVKRFLTALISPAAAVAPPGLIDEVTEIAKQPVPGLPPPGKQPWLLWIGAGAAGAVSIILIAKLL